MSDPFSMQWDQLGAAVAGVGALGAAAFGVVESVGKAFAFSYRQGPHKHLRHVGLAYVGLGSVRRMIGPLRPALKLAYGADYEEIVAQQYRAGRSDGPASDTIRQGVRLGLPFLEQDAATALIAAVWDMPAASSGQLAAALKAPAAAPAAGGGAAGAAAAAPAIDPAQALAGRFATALDARINAAFQVADEQYEASAKSWAAVVSVALAVGFNIGMAKAGVTPLPWPIDILAGLVAVPLAPVAKDLSTSLQNALTAFKSISGKPS
ncbi:hypothetical protein [Phenylobacterium montanum]|uniref:Uncharacterized protein n=1 Tax=Phenylobacterium montanum TaxID=2823693 RepID=A0A975FZE1_9CAUL|nr:hypothetical protein [Caulobacter sp. S6]QUD87949.1 hypothetical protein KCG34_23405 [Caulobacter sp. S6]